MKATDAFTDTIKAYLDNRASSDALFSVTYKKEKKNIADCVTYILNEVKKSGNNGFTDDEIFGMAVHYYDEDNIVIGDKAVNANVVVNHKVDKPKTEAPKKAATKPPEKKPTPAPMSIVKSATNKFFVERKEEEPKKPEESKPEEKKPSITELTLF